ncbi:unnamed protein product [Musa hybrid cultivar]
MGTPNEFKGLQCPPRPGALLLTKMLMAGRGSDADRTKVPAVQPPPTPPPYSTFSQLPPTESLIFPFPCWILDPPLPFCGIGIGWAL